METVKSVDIGPQLNCLHRPDRCLPTCSDLPTIQKASSVHVRGSGLSVHGLTLWNGPTKSLEFYHTDGHYSIAPASMRHPSISLHRHLAYKRSLIRNRLISHTKYCLQTVQSLGFIPNLKKSDLISAQKFVFIGMKFLT